MAVTAADNVPQITAATMTGMRKVNETGGSARIYCMNRRRASVATMKMSAMVTPVTPPGAIALRTQIRAGSKYCIARASARRQEPVWESKQANCRADRRMLIGGIRTHREQNSQ